MTDDTFAADVAALLPDLRRYCARLLGSLFDGDDAAQDAIAAALAKRHMLLDGAPLRPWVFRIAHNRCVDLMRRDGRWRAERDETDLAAEAGGDVVDLGERRSRALALLGQLPPRQRAMVLLREVYGFSLEETASVLVTSVDAVKSGQRRARRALEALVADGAAEAPAAADDPSAGLVGTYAALVDAGDWDGLLELIHADVQLDVAGIYCGVGRDKVFNRYFHNYCAFDFPWRAVAADLPSGACVLSLRVDGAAPKLVGVTRVRSEGGRVVQITDWLHDDGMVGLVREEALVAGLLGAGSALAARDRSGPPVVASGLV